MSEAARAIYQANLDTVTRAFWRRDMARLGDLLHVPTWMRLADAEVLVSTWDELRAVLEAQRDSLDRMGATEYHRICIGAEWAEGRDDWIQGRHMTYILRGGAEAVPPYPCTMDLRRFGVLWMACALDCAIRNRDLPMAPKGSTSVVRRGTGRGAGEGGGEAQP